MSHQKMNHLVPAAEQALIDIGNIGRELIKRAEITVVAGAYDQAEMVLDAIDGIEFKKITPGNINRQFFRGTETLFINCPGYGIDSHGQKKIKNFVSDGGWMVTTDWCLSNVIEQIFPKTIQCGRIKTPDDVVAIEPIQSPITDGVIDGSEFWLESSSYTIEPIMEVVSIIESVELQRKYNSKYVMVGFKYGQGKVFHAISHFNLQRSKSGDTRLQDTYSSIRLITNILAQKSAVNTKRKSNG